MTITPPQDYHMHSDVSCDSHVSMAEMCRSALGSGLTEIAFTEHFDMHPADICTGFYQPAVYFDKLNAARQEFGGLTIRAGVELGEYHRYKADQQPVLDAWPYDFVLGSMHWVADESIFDQSYFRSRSPHEAAADYFAELVQMVSSGGFDVLAHADVFKRTGHSVYGDVDAGTWEDLLRPVWRACIENGIGIEINTSGLRQGVGETHPALVALRWYREMGGEILTTGSDSHRPEHVALGLSRALDLAREAGFTRLASFEGRRVARWLPI